MKERAYRENDIVHKEDKFSFSVFKSFHYDILLIVLLALLAFYLIALLSYDPQDRSYNSITIPELALKNLAGIFGAYLSGFVVYYSGLGAFLFPFFLFSLLKHLTFQTISKKILSHIVICQILLFVAFSCLITKTYPFYYYRDYKFLTMGVLGLKISSVIDLYCGSSGSLTISVAFIACSLVLLSQKNLFSWVVTQLYSCKKSLVFFPRKLYKNAIFSSTDFLASLKNVLTFSKFKKQNKVDPQSEPALFETQDPLVTNDFLPADVSALNVEDIFFHQKKENSTIIDEETPQKSQLIEKTLGDFGIQGKIIGYQQGPVLTVFEFQPAAGIKQSKVIGLADDIALSLKVESVLIQPLHNKNALGIQVPNADRRNVLLGELLSSLQFNYASSPLAFALGRSITGEILCEDIIQMPHLLIAGTTGSGKSVGVNSLICSILTKSSPQDVRLLLIDPKMLEFSIYNGIPHLLQPVITDIENATSALQWAEEEMERRYKLMETAQVRNIKTFNSKNPTSKLPYILIVIDELADLMLQKTKEFESIIQRLAQKSRACGIHLVLATQRPSVDVVTGVIKANFPARISFQVASRHDSRTIIDQIGSEKLLGKGDLLFMKPGASKLLRAQGAFVSEEEIHAFVLRLKEKANSLIARP